MAFEGDSPVRANLTEGTSIEKETHENSHAKLYGEIALAAGAALAVGAFIATRGKTAGEVLPEAEQAMNEVHGVGGADIGLLERAEWNEMLAARKARIIHGEGFDPDAVSDFGPRRSVPTYRSNPYIFPEGKLVDGPDLNRGIIRNPLFAEAPEMKLERLVNAHRIGFADLLGDAQTPRSRFAWLTDLLKRRS